VTTQEAPGVIPEEMEGGKGLRVTLDLKGNLKDKMSKRGKPHLKHQRIKDNLEMGEQPIQLQTQQKQVRRRALEVGDQK
jgi:hypothetical protein